MTSTQVQLMVIYTSHLKVMLRETEEVGKGKRKRELKEVQQNEWVVKESEESEEIKLGWKRQTKD